MYKLRYFDTIRIVRENYQNENKEKKNTHKFVHAVGYTFSLSFHMNATFMITKIYYNFTTKLISMLHSMRLYPFGVIIYESTITQQIQKLQYS